MEKMEQKILSIEDIDDLMKNINFEINYRTNGINQVINRINKKFTDDICELNKKYDYWLNNKNFVLYNGWSENFRTKVACRVDFS